MTTAEINQTNQLLRSKDLAQLLQISAHTLARMRTAGAFPVPAVEWPGRPRWRRADVSVWLGGVPDLADHDFQLLTIPQTAVELGIAKSTMYRMLGDPAVARLAVRLLGEVRFPRARLRLYRGESSISSNAAS